MAPILVVALASLTAIAGCSSPTSTPTMPTMPTESHGLPTVLGPLSGTGNKTFTVTVRPAMSIELGCLGKGKDLAWVRSPIGSFAVPCDSSPGNESFASGYDSAQDLRGAKLKVCLLYTSDA